MRTRDFQSSTSHPHYKVREVHPWRVTGLGRVYLGTPQELLAVMDSKNVRAMVNLTAGYDKALGDVIFKYDHAFQDRFYAFTEPCYERLLETGYPQLQAEAIERAHRQGARGLKILKTLAIYLRENITSAAREN